MHKDLLIFGTSKYTQLVEHYFHTYTDYRVCGYTVNRKYLQSDTYNQKPLVPFEEVEIHFPKEQVTVFIAVGLTDINRARRNLFLQFEERGYRFASFIHPQAMVDPTVTLGRHCIIMENVVIQAYCDVGDDLIFFPSSSLTHHATIGSHAFVASGVQVGGCTTIGEETFLGLGTIIKDFSQIGSQCFLASGCVISKDVPDATACMRDGRSLSLSGASRNVLAKMLTR